MGAVVKKSFVYVCLMMLALVLGLFGCGDIYKNMKISVDTTEMVLYLNGGEDEPSSKQVKATISGVKDKSVIKDVQAVFDDEKIASAGAITYAGDDAYITIHASSPGTTQMYIKSLDNTKRVSSEAITITVIEKLESIDVSGVVASVARGTSIDLALLPNIVFSPSVTYETDLEFYFPTGTGGGTNSSVFGQIVDKHIFYASSTADEGFCEILVKSTKLTDFDATSPLQKTFSILVYTDYSSDDIVLSIYSEKDARYEVFDDEELVLMSNYVDTTGLPSGTSVSIDKMVLVGLKNGLSENLKNYYNFSIQENSQTQKSVVKVDSGLTDVLNEFKITPNQTGTTSLSLVVSLERDGKTYVVKERPINIVVKTIVKTVEITTDDQTVAYNIDVEPIIFAAVGVFERANYNGVSGTKIIAKTSPERVVNPRYKVLLGDGYANDGSVILRKDFENFISVSNGSSLVDYGEDGVEFENGSTFYISYEPSMLLDDVAKNLSSFELYVVANYDEGLKRVQAEIVCSVFKSLKELRFVGDETGFICENNDDLNIEVTANDNIDLNLLNVVYDKEMFDFLGISYKIEESGLGEIVENKKFAVASFKSKKLGESTIGFVEKYTYQSIIGDVFVVVPTDDVYLTINRTAYEGVGEVDGDEIDDGVFLAEVVKAQSGSTFYLNVNTTQEGATLKDVVDFEFVDDSYLLLRESVVANLSNGTIRIGTNANNYASNIYDETTYAVLSVTIGYYAYEEGVLVAKTKTQQIKIGTYKKLVEFSFGNKLTTKTVGIYNQNELSIANQEKENIGYVQINPIFEKADGSSYDYYLESLYFPNGSPSSDWRVEYIDIDVDDEPILMKDFKGLKIYFTGEDLINEQIKIQLSVKEFGSLYSVVCTINAISPSPKIEDVFVNDAELYVENWESDYNTAQIKTSVTPVSVFDENLSYVVFYKNIEENDVVTMVYDNYGADFIARFTSSSDITLEKTDGKIFVKCSNNNVITPYYVAVLPSYLLNFTDDVDNYETRVLEIINDNKAEINEVGLCKIISINVANGDQYSPYKIEKLSDMQNIHNSTVNESGKYFVITNDLEFDESWTAFELKANISSQDDAMYSIYDVTTPLFDTIDVSAGVSNISIRYQEINVTTNEFGLLAIENKGTVSNVSIYPSYTTTGTSQITITQQNDADIVVGSLVAKNSGNITNCYGQTNIVVNLISTENNAIIGGFVGQNEGNIKVEPVSEILYASTFTSTIEVKGPTQVGEYEVGDCYFNGDKYVVITDDTFNAENITIYKNTENSFVGGLVGINNNVIDSTPTMSATVDKLTNINVISNITAPICDNVGGIAGQNNAVIKGVLVSPKIEARNNIGGAVGVNNSTASPSLSYVLTEFYNNRNDKTSIYANENVGGLVGTDDGSQINACYVTSYIKNEQVDITRNQGFHGDIHANNNIGGLVGKGTKTNISQCFADISIGLNGEEDAVAGGLVGTLNVQNMNGQISTSYAINNFGTTDRGLFNNKMGQLVGVIVVNEATNVLSNCYAVTNGGVLNVIIDDVLTGYCYEALANVLISGTYSSLITDDDVEGLSTQYKNVCTNCYYANVTVIAPTDIYDHITIRTIEEMQSLSNYNNFASSAWAIIYTANGGFPILKVNLNGYSFELYNSQIGSIGIEEYKSDDFFETILPKFAKFANDQFVVILDMLYQEGKQGFTLTLEDLLTLNLEAGVKIEDFEVVSQDESIVQVEENNKNDESRFVLNFQKTGLVKISIQAKQNSAISKTIQICVVGGFEDYIISNEELYIAKGGSNTTIITYEQQSNTFYNDKNLVKLEVVELEEGGEIPDPNVTANGSEFSSQVIDKLDLTTNKTIMFTGIGNAGTTNLIKITPYITVYFSNELGIVQSYDLLLKTSAEASYVITPQSIKSNFTEFKTITTNVFEGVNSINLNEDSASLQNSGRLDVELVISSDAINEIKGAIQDNLNVIVTKNVFNEDTQQYEEIEYGVAINWDENKFELSDTSAIMFSQNIVDGKMILSFSLEHEKNKMTYEETENWYFSYQNQDGTLKTAELNVVWLPSSIENIEVLHFINKTEYADGMFATVGVDQATSKIASGSTGVLKISITQEYSNYDYLIVKGVSSADEITFARLMEYVGTDGNRKLVSDFGLYSEPLLDGGIKLENLFGKDVNDGYVNAGNGVYYVSTLTRIGLPENTEFLIDVYAYKITESGDQLVYSTNQRNETTKLLSAFAPYVYLSVADDVARTTDGGLLARGTSLQINMVGVLEQSSVSVSLSGFLIPSGGGNVLTNCIHTWKNMDATTSLNFQASFDVYAGINSLAANTDGRLTLSATVQSQGFSTTTEIYLYLVDYLVTGVGVEKVDDDGIYAIKIQDGYKPLRLTLGTAFGDFSITSNSDDNLSNAWDMVKEFYTISTDDASYYTDIYNSFKNSYQIITQNVIDKVKEFNALGTRNAAEGATIWQYRNSNLNVAANSYEYFYLMVDNKVNHTNVVSIWGKQAVNINLSVNLHRGAKLSQNGNYYDLILQATSITESYLDVSSGDYYYEFTIQFIDDSSSDLPIPISSEQELKTMVAGGHYILTKDIVVTNWVPLTTQIGSLDGNGYKIIVKNYNITTTGSTGAPLTSLNAGLFASISNYYDTKTESTEPTRLTNIVLDVSQTVVVNLGNATGVNFGFLVGCNDGGVIYNCEVISGVSSRRAKLTINSDVDVDIIAESTQLYDSSYTVQKTISDFEEYLEYYQIRQQTKDLVGTKENGMYSFILEDGTRIENVDADKYDNFEELFYKYEQYIEIVGKQGKSLVLADGEVVNIFGDSAKNLGFNEGIIYNSTDGTEVVGATQENVMADGSVYLQGGYYVFKTSYVELTDESLSVFNYDAWKGVYDEVVANNNLGQYAKDVSDKILESQDTTIIYVISGATASSSSTINIGGLVGENAGFISNSRIGRLDDVVVTTEENQGRSGVDENNDGIVDSLMQDYGLSIFGCGRLGGFAAINSGVISASYFANSNLVNMQEITNNQYITTGGFVALNSGEINTSYVEGRKDENEISFVTQTNILDGVKTERATFTIKGIEYDYQSIENTQPTILQGGKIVAIVSSDNTFVLDGVEYTIINTEGDNYMIDYVRRTRNNIYFSGEIGGFVHINDGEIENSYSNIGLKSTLSVGGFVYNNRQTLSSIKDCYSACAIDNENAINGAFVGSNKAHDVYNSGIVENSYYLIDSAVTQNSKELASAVDAINLCVYNNLLLGFVFETEGQNGIWTLDKNNEFDGPKLVEANRYAYSSRVIVMNQGMRTCIYTTFGNKENPRIVYSKASFNNIAVNDSFKVAENVRVVADIDFEQQNPTFNGELSSKFSIDGTSFIGNGMTLKNVNIVADENTQTDYLGLFKTIEGKGVVSNLNLVLSAFDGTMTEYVGSLSGCVNNAYVNNIKVSAEVTDISVRGRNVVGGAIGLVAGADSKIANVECSISVNSTYDAMSASNIQFIVENPSSNANKKITNIQNVSYAGGVVGAVISSTRRYNDPVLVNCSVVGNFIMKAEVVGGIAGFVSEKAAITECKLILNSSATGQEIQSGSIAGGLVGENRGLISFSYISLDEKTQDASDKKLREDGLYDEQIGTSSLFTGENNVIGGLVGLNVGTNKTSETEYSGGIRFSYSRVRVVNENALAAGGLVGMAVASIDEISTVEGVNVEGIANVVNGSYIRRYRNIIGDEATYKERSGDTEVMRQSLFLYGVYTTGSVKASKVAGGLVGVATALVSTMENDVMSASVVVLPDTVSVMQGNYNGFVIGKANFIAEKRDTAGEVKNVYFSQNGCVDSSGGISTIVGSSKNLIGNIDNDLLLDDNYFKKMNETATPIKYYSLFDVIHYSQNHKIAFEFMWNLESNYMVDSKFESYVFPKLTKGLKIKTDDILTVEDYLTIVKGGERGNYRIIGNLEFDFNETINEKTIADWFNSLYGEKGPSGTISGVPLDSATRVTITIKNNNSGIPFFGGNIEGLKVSNIDFVFENDHNMEPIRDESSSINNNLYWGLLANTASSCEFININVKYPHDKEINVNKFNAVGGLVGYSSSNSFNKVDVEGVSLVQTEYELWDENVKSLYFGGVTGLSNSDQLDDVRVTTSSIIITTTNAPSDVKVFVGGISGAASTQYWINNNRSSASSSINNLCIEMTTKDVEENIVGTVYAGGICGQVVSSGIIKATHIYNSTITVTAKDASIGGLSGYVSGTLITNCSVENESSITAHLWGTNAYVGGMIGNSSCKIEHLNNSLQTNGAISSNATNINIQVDAQNMNGILYVGGLVAYLDLDDFNITYDNVTPNEVGLFNQNQTSGSIYVKGNHNNTAYIAGIFGTVVTKKSDSKVAISKSASNTTLHAEDIQKVYMGGVCADCRVILNVVANYASLTNEYSGSIDNNCVSYMGGIAAYTSGLINTCLSLGAIFEPSFVDYTYIDGSGVKEEQKSYAEAIVAGILTPEEYVFNSSCLYSSDFTGILQTIGNIKEDQNVSASDVLTKTLLPVADFAQTTSDTTGYDLIHIQGLNSVRANRLSSFNSLENNKIYILTKDISEVNESVTLDVENVSIVGCGAKVTTNGCALFEEIPARVLVSSLQVVSSVEIETTSNFGLLTIENNGLISNCMAGSLPTQNQVESSNINVKYLSNGLAGEDKKPGCSESGILTINIASTANNISVGALVGINNKVIVNSLSYADVNINTESTNIVYASNLVGENKFKVNYSYALGKLNVNVALHASSCVGEVIGKTITNKQSYVNQLIGYVDVNTVSSAVGGVVGGSNMGNTGMFYVYDLSRTTVTGWGATGLTMSKIYEKQTIQPDSNFFIGGFDKDANYEYLYGLYTLRIHKDMFGLKTYNSEKYEIENFAEFNLMNHLGNNTSYVFVRDLVVTTKLNNTNIDTKTGLTIDGAGHYLFANQLIDSGTGVYTVFNIKMNGGTIKNIMFQFGDTTINTSGNVIIAPIVRQISGGTISNCAVVGDVTLTSTYESTNKGVSYGGICEELSGNATMERCWSGVSLTITNSNSQVVAGGLVSTMANGSSQTQKTTLTECFVDSTIELKRDGTNNLYVGGLVGEITGNNVSVENSYLTEKSKLLTNVVNATNTNVYMGEFVGKMEFSITNTNLFKYLIFEGTFVDEYYGDFEGENYYTYDSGSIKVGPKFMTFNVGKIFTALAVGKLSDNAGVSVETEALSDNVVFDSVLSTYKAGGVALSLDEGVNSLTKITGGYQGQYVDYNNILDTDGNDVFATNKNDTTTEMYPYLRNVTPSDKHP